ncbi:hypothetical protein J6590_080676 [Homalodisca vitripennis]|nr:hypothetical protein J6590_080676 [Homalodisca vitripennis]
MRMSPKRLTKSQDLPWQQLLGGPSDLDPKPSWEFKSGVLEWETSPPGGAATPLPLIVAVTSDHCCPRTSQAASWRRYLANAQSPFD